MKQSLRRRLDRKKREREQRIRKQKERWRTLRCPKVKLELSDRVNAVNCGGLANVQMLTQQIGLPQAINRGCPIFKLCMPYSESDHVLNVAFNIFAGGTCLEHIELRRNDDAYLGLLGADRIPDPTTAADFCRRFDSADIDRLMDAINESRLRVWQQQPDSFFDRAIIEGDGTMIETSGEKKEGIGLNHKKQWGYQVLAITLANTREQLFLKNRPGNRPSHEGAAAYFDRSVELCRRAGFRNVRLRGDTDFSQTVHLDRWHNDNVEFVFGYDAAPNLVKIAENIANSAWKPLQRPAKPGGQSGKTRARRPNHKEAFVVEKEYLNQILEDEDVAEFSYRPTACRHSYRMIVLRKTIRVMKGQALLFREPKYFFYITNLPKNTMPAHRIVRESNLRCDQENIFAQGKAMGALAAPLDNINSNWAYMVMAMLAWNLKCWMSLSLKLAGNSAAREKRAEQKRRMLRMDFSTFRQRLIHVPAQILEQGRQLTCRLLQWTPSTELIVQLYDSVSMPLRH
ncbi:MAG: IS1380 family transposase [Hyphomicrobiaceae bacterium]